MEMKWGRVRLLAGVVGVSLVGAASASAATVSNTNDAGPGSLRQAILDAGPGETITVPAGSYGVGSELAIAKSLTIAGAGPSSTILGSTGSDHRMIGVSGAGTQVTISGLTVRGAKFSGGEGAGIRNSEAQLTLRDVVVSGNVLELSAPLENGGNGRGAGIASVGPDSRLTMSGGLVAGNRIYARGGGDKRGGFAQGAGLYVLRGDAEIETTTFKSNGIDVGGGQGPASPEQKGGVGEGAGIDISEPLGRVAIRRSTVAGNSIEALEGPGGKSGIAEGAGIAVIASTGAIYLEGLTVTGNRTRTGGVPGISAGAGVKSATEGAATLQLSGSTLAANTAEGAGASGGNLRWQPRTLVIDSILSGGTAAGAPSNCAAEGGGGTSFGFNLESGDSCGFHAAGDRTNTDPQLGVLTNNGGPTETMMPAETSPVIDQGSVLAGAVDQRGVARPIDIPEIANPGVPGADGSDIGAVEVQPPSSFAIAGFKRLRGRGTGILIVTLPQLHAGALSLTGRGLRSQRVSIDGAATRVRLKVVGRRGLARVLNRHGRRKVELELVYSPLANRQAGLNREAVLVKRRRHRHRKHHHRPHHKRRH
jgi:hypothetical protein